MTAQDIIAARSPSGWLPTPRLLALWQTSSAAQSLSPGLVIANPQGIPSPLFASLCRQAFPIPTPGVQTFLPIAAPIVTASGQPTRDLISWWNRVT